MFSFHNKSVDLLKQEEDEYPLRRFIAICRRRRRQNQMMESIFHLLPKQVVYTVHLNL